MSTVAFLAAGIVIMAASVSSTAPATTAFSSSTPHISSSSLPSFLFLLADDVGYGDFGYMNGTVNTPNIDALAYAQSSIRFMDFHAGGAVCSPTRATVLTGRHHFRDCIRYVYDCSDMTECVPDFVFAPNRTFTVPMAVRAANEDYQSYFVGKWHLGSFYNDSEKYGGVTSSPITHGFDRFNATVEVAPTATPNCNCRSDWQASCEYGHDSSPSHCDGDEPGPTGSECCFNYWWNDDTKPHGVTNLTEPVPVDDSVYVTDTFELFLSERKQAGNKPFFAQLSFHNCHVPYIGRKDIKEACREGKVCKPGNYSLAQLDYFACLIELDDAVGRVLDILAQHGYRDNTMLWLTSDNGPEGLCFPEGRCVDEEFKIYPGSAGPLRGRKRDIWEGGHRVPGIVSWPAVIKQNRESWDTVVTTDLLPTVMDILNVSRPESQRQWGFDGVSIMPLVTGQGQYPTRAVGWMFQNSLYRGFRYGKWKVVTLSQSCGSLNCTHDMLFDMENDHLETTDLSTVYPDTLNDMKTRLNEWYDGVQHSRKVEQGCHGLE